VGNPHLARAKHGRCLFRHKTALHPRHHPQPLCIKALALKPFHFRHFRANFRVSINRDKTFRSDGLDHRNPFVCLGSGPNELRSSSSLINTRPTTYMAVMNMFARALPSHPTTTWQGDAAQVRLVKLVNTFDAWRGMYRWLI
jgi:hypothetical protein